MLIYWTNNKKNSLNHSFIGEDSASFVNIFSCKSNTLPSNDFSCSFETKSDECSAETFSFVKKVEEFEKENLINEMEFNMENFIALEENAKLLYEFIQNEEKCANDRERLMNILTTQIDTLLSSKNGLEIISNLLLITKLKEKHYIVGSLLHNIEYLVENSDKEIFSIILRQIIKMNSITYINIIVYAIIKNFKEYLLNEISRSIIAELYALHNDFITLQLNKSAFLMINNNH